MILRDYFIALVFISFVFVGSFSFLTGMANQDPVLAAQLGTYSSFNQTSRVLEIGQNLQGNASGLVGMLQNIPLGGEIAAVTLGATQILTITFQLPGIYSAMIADISAAWHLPDWVFWGIQAIILITVLFVIISSISKWRI